MNSKLFEKVLREATFSWDLDPSHRSWIIFSDGRLFGGSSHRSIIKNNFSNDWNASSEDSDSETDTEIRLERKFLRSGAVYVGESSAGFYSTMWTLNDGERNILQGFASSIVKIKDNPIKRTMRITCLIDNSSISCTISDLLDDKLFRD